MRAVVSGGALEAGAMLRFVFLGGADEVGALVGIKVAET
jgi:hypothetical protein